MGFWEYLNGIGKGATQAIDNATSLQRSANESARTEVMTKQADTQNKLSEIALQEAQRKLEMENELAGHVKTFQDTITPLKAQPSTVQANVTQQIPFGTAPDTAVGGEEYGGKNSVDYLAEIKNPTKDLGILEARGNMFNAMHDTYLKYGHPEAAQKLRLGKFENIARLMQVAPGAGIKAWNNDPMIKAEYGELKPEDITEKAEADSLKFGRDGTGIAVFWKKGPKAGQMEIKQMPTDRGAKMTGHVGVNPANGRPEYIDEDGKFSGIVAYQKPEKGDSELADELKRQRLEDMKDKKGQVTQSKFNGLMKSMQDDVKAVDAAWDASLKSTVAEKDRMTMDEYNRRIKGIKARYGAALEPYRKEGLWSGWDGEQAQAPKTVAPATQPQPSHAGGQEITLSTGKKIIVR